MRAGLDSLNQRNRNEEPFTIDDVAPYLEFFNHHGNANDRVLAHYLMGRAYHAHGEAPMALKQYQQAVECALTSDKQIDLNQLCRVYSQMGGIFYQQGLYHEQINHMKKAVHCALTGGDTIAAIMSYEQLSYAYDALGNIDSAVAVIENAARQYERFGYRQDAAIALGSIVRPLILADSLGKASIYLHVYETESGLFNERGEITRGREAYYNSKGMFYLKKKDYGSAKYWFQKELNEGKDWNNQNGGAYGLGLVFYQLHQYDSAAFYYHYAYAINDSMHAERISGTVKNIQGLYNYNRIQELARQKSIEAQNEKTKRQFLIVIFIAFAIASILIIHHILVQQKLGLEKYKESLHELQIIRKEKENFIRHQDEYSQIIAEKDKKIAILEEIRRKYGKQIYFTTANAERCLKESPLFADLTKKAVKGILLNSQDWQHAHDLIREYLPGFDDFMATNRHKLTPTEYQICLLLRIHFRAVDIAGALNISKSKVSQASTQVMKEFFQKKGSSKELHTKLAEFFDQYQTLFSAKFPQTVCILSNYTL